MDDTDQMQRVWKTRDNQELRVCEMKRTHVQNSLQWCMQRTGDLDWDGFPETKDGFTYEEWVATFLVRLLDPDCK